MYRVIVFDAYGTLFDVYSIAALAERLYPGHGAAVSTLWRDKQIEYSRLISMSDPHGVGGSRLYQPFWELTRSALAYALKRLKLDAAGPNIDALMDQYARLRAFPENLQVLQALKLMGLQTAILSNGSPDMLASAVASAGMHGYLDQVISVDEVRHFKTMPESYALVQRHFPGARQEVLFVSSNAWDAVGAGWFGFDTFWVNRADAPFEEIGPRPTHSGVDLRHVLEVVR